MNRKYKNLLKNMSIFAIGTFSSKILVFLIVPLYTYVLSTSDYGKIDLITSTISLFIPFTTLLFYEAAIRFLIAKEYDSKKIFNNCFLIFIYGCILSILVAPIIISWLNLGEYCLIFVALLILNNYSTIFGQYLRAVGKNWAFSISGIINTLCTLVLNIIMLLFFKLGINGYLYSLLIAQIITGIFIFINCNTIKLLKLKLIDMDAMKKMLAYSIPLVPNNIMWWIMNAGDKYVINFFLGTDANGIFSIAYKIPTILTMVFSIFMQAWQVSAIEEMKDEKRDEFYKTIFNYINFILVFTTAGIILFVQPLFETVIGKGFVSSWEYVPLLCIANLFNCLSTFAGVVYITEKRSKQSFVTTFVGAIANLAFNFMLIVPFGLFGVSIGTAMGYLLVMILRFKDFKKYYNIRLVNAKFILLLAIIVVDSITYIVLDNFVKYIIAIISILLILIASKDDIVNVLSIIKKKIFAKKVA